jgi:hypothetical protein
MVGWPISGVFTGRIDTSNLVRSLSALPSKVSRGYHSVFIDSTESLCTIFECVTWLSLCVSLTALSRSALFSNVSRGYHSVSHWQRWVSLRHLLMCHVVITVSHWQRWVSLRYLLMCHVVITVWLIHNNKLFLSLCVLSSAVLSGCHTVAHPVEWV